MGLCYRLFNEASLLTWMESETKCKESNGSLASISSESEAQFLHELTLDYLTSWIYIGECFTF